MTDTHAAGIDASIFAAERELDLDAFAELLNSAHKVAVIGHIRPDADAIGSVCALVGALTLQGISARGFIGQTEPCEESLATLPGFEAITFTDQLPGDIDTVITVDCGDQPRTGALAPQVGEYAARGRCVVIDHHASNPGFGSINLVIAGWESTTLLLWRMFSHLGWSINDDIAHALYGGLVTDTGSFRWGGARMHAMATDMLGYNIAAAAITRELMDSRTVDDLRLIGDALQTFTVLQAPQSSLRMCFIAASYELTSRHRKEAVEALTEYIRAVDGSDFGVVAKEYQPGVYQLSFRAAETIINDIAIHLGGGGHHLAAGATVPAASIVELQETIIAAVDAVKV